MWLVGRLATKARLLQWKMVNDDDCPLCSSGPETVSHLFFHCNATRTVWLGQLGQAGSAF